MRQFVYTSRACAAHLPRVPRRPRGGMCVTRSCDKSITIDELVAVFGAVAEAQLKRLQINIRGCPVTLISKSTKDKLRERTNMGQSLTFDLDSVRL
jgi:hypothetical protein